MQRPDGSFPFFHYAPSDIYPNAVGRTPSELTFPNDNGKIERAAVAMALSGKIATAPRWSAC
jgi:hypothetical protein